MYIFPGTAVTEPKIEFPENIGTSSVLQRGGRKKEGGEGHMEVSEALLLISFSHFNRGPAMLATFHYFECTKCLLPHCLLFAVLFVQNTLPSYL